MSDSALLWFRQDFRLADDADPAALPAHGVPLVLARERGHRMAAALSAERRKPRLATPAKWKAPAELLAGAGAKFGRDYPRAAFAGRGEAASA